MKSTKVLAGVYGVVFNMVDHLGYDTRVEVTVQHNSMSGLWVMGGYVYSERFVHFSPFPEYMIIQAKTKKEIMEYLQTIHSNKVLDLSS